MERLSLRLRGVNDGLRWSSPEQWHITLAFLGSVESAGESVLLRELRRIRLPPAALAIDGLGLFERVGILYAAVEVMPALAELQRATAEAVRASGLALEDRPYRPHVTLARSKGRAGMQTLKRLRPMLEQQRPCARWTATEFLLYESQPSPGGSQYLVRARFALAESAGADGRNTSSGLDQTSPLKGLRRTIVDA